MTNKLFSIAFLGFLLLASFSTPNKQPRYYQSEWSIVQPASSMGFEHMFNVLPSSVNVYVANYLAEKNEPLMAIPYLEAADHCISISYVNINKIMISNECDYPSNYIRVDAVYYGN